MNNTTNRTSFQQIHEQGGEINNNNNNNSYCYYYLDTQPGVHVDEREEYDRRRAVALEKLSIDREVIIQAYADALGIPLSNIVANMMVDFVMSGHSVADLLDAIERTAFAPKPSPAYLRAVLHNYDTYKHPVPKSELPF